MSPDRLMLMRQIARIGDANWYTLGRVALGRMQDQDGLTTDIRWLVEHGFVSEAPVEGEPLPRLAITERGRRALAGTPDPAPAPERPPTTPWDYTLSATERAHLTSPALPDRWPALERALADDPKWRILRVLDDRVVLAHSGGAVAVLERSGDRITGRRLIEGEGARRLLAEYAFAADPAVRMHAARTLRPGQPARGVLAEAFPAEALADLRVDPGGAPADVARTRTVRIGTRGVVTLEIDAEGRLRGHRWFAGAEALALIDADTEARRWSAAPFPRSDLRARTPAEARLYVAFMRGDALADRWRDGRLQILADTPRGRQIFTFDCDARHAAGPHDFGPGPSRLLDPAGLVLLGEREQAAARQTGGSRPSPARLRLAAAGVREAMRTIPDGADGPPERAFFTRVGQHLHQRSPEKFSRAALEALARALDGLADEFEAASPATDSIVARDRREASWRLRALGAPADLVDERGDAWRILGPGDAERVIRVRLDPKRAGPEPEIARAVAERIAGGVPTRLELLGPALLEWVRAELEDAVACLAARDAAHGPDAARIDALARPLRDRLAAARRAAEQTRPRQIDAPPPPLSDATRLRLLREMAEGRPLMQALSAAADRAAIVLAPLAQSDAGDGRMQRYLVVTEVDDDGPRMGLVAAVTEGDAIRGRHVLTGSGAQDQRQRLVERLGPPPAGAAPHVREAALAEQLRPLLARAARGDARAVAALRPRPGDTERAFAPEVARQIAAAQARRASDPRPAADPSQTEIALHLAPVGALNEHDPRGRPFARAWHTMAARGVLRPDRIWATWTHRRPGEARGVRYDGLVWLDDHWAWFPKPWRALK